MRHHQTSAAALIAILNRYLQRRQPPSQRIKYRVMRTIRWTDPRGPELDRLIAEGLGDKPSMTMKEFRRRER